MKNTLLSSYNELQKSLRVEVKISPDEVDRLIVNRLISIRNFEGNRNDDMTHIDKTLRFFLSSDEFQKYVIENQEIEY